MDNAPILGLYDQLLTRHLADQVSKWRSSGHRIDVDQVDREEVAHLLGRFVGEIAARTFALRKSPEEQVALANRVLGLLEDSDELEDGPSRRRCGGRRRRRWGRRTGRAGGCR